MADIYVNSEELKLIATGMKTKATSIMESYQNDASSAILMGSECLQISGLDTTTLLNSFNKIFTNLGTKINTLADFLSTTVANEYDSTTSAITNEFNNNFANEIAGILGISVGKGALSSGSSAATPWPKDVELDPGFSYPGKPSTGGDTTNPGDSSTTPGGNGGSNLDPDFGYPKNPSTGGDTSTPGTTPGTGGSNPGGSTTTPGGNLGKLDPDFGYPKNPSTGGDTSTPGITPGTGGSNPGGSTTTPGGNLGKLDPDFGYPKNPSTGGSTSTPGTTPGTGTTTPSTPSTNPGTSSGVATPWPDGVNLDPGFGYPSKANMKDNLGAKFDNVINIGGTGNLSGNRPIYELPVQPKPTPEIMSNNVMR